MRIRQAERPGDDYPRFAMHALSLNRPGLGLHVSNAAFMVSPSGRGVCVRTCRASLDLAPSAGYARRFELTGESPMDDRRPLAETSQEVTGTTDSTGAPTAAVLGNDRASGEPQFGRPDGCCRSCSGPAGTSYTGDSGLRDRRRNRPRGHGSRVPGPRTAPQWPCAIKMILSGATLRPRRGCDSSPRPRPSPSCTTRTSFRFTTSARPTDCRSSSSSTSPAAV